jgi:Rad3-related DNA helicase
MIGGYEHRAAQLEMAELVQDAFAANTMLRREPGRKTLAYLLPAICSGRQLVISTPQVVQEQLYQRYPLSAASRRS